MDWTDWTRGLPGSLGMIRRRLGERATSPGPASDLGKRQTLFEHEAVMFVRERMDRFPQTVRLEAEGYNPVGPEDAEWIIGFDPTDGTAGDARQGGTGIYNGLPVSCVLAVRRNVPNPTFASVEYAGILDLHHGDIFVAEPANTEVKVERMSCRPQYNIHAPAVGWEIARRANAFLRFLIPYGVYPEMVADSHSSASVMLWALQGYIDAWLNFNLPGIEGAGQRGHELGAIAVFARAMGACAVQTKVEGNQVVIAGNLDDAPYTFDGQTSVILGPDRKIVDHYLGLINAGLLRDIILGATTMKLGEVLVELYRQYPSGRFSLPLISD
ncbi:MAG: hypothetical protein Q8R55_01535 [Candidatus Taylorbacteria bacterium]|nr:hypothetical protein [Candidatus Taylorbacteria bacterium]